MKQQLQKCPDCGIRLSAGKGKHGLAPHGCYGDLEKEVVRLKDELAESKAQVKELQRNLSREEGNLKKAQADAKRKKADADSKLAAELEKVTRDRNEQKRYAARFMQDSKAQKSRAEKSQERTLKTAAQMNLLRGYGDAMKASLFRPGKCLACGTKGGHGPKCAASDWDAVIDGQKIGDYFAVEVPAKPGLMAIWDLRPKLICEVREGQLEAKMKELSKG